MQQTLPLTRHRMVATRAASARHAATVWPLWEWAAWLPLRPLLRRN